MVGLSFLPLLKGLDIPWRKQIFYEYYWEYDYPETPTMFGVRTDRYKYIRYYGLWDTNEFYDLKELTRMKCITLLVSQNFKTR